jgi:signal transduction histidine kinase
MEEILRKCLDTNQIIARHNFSAQEIGDLTDYLRKTCIASYVEQVVRMVEEVISIDPSMGWKEILEAAAKKIVEFLHAAAASIRIFDPETDKLVAFGSHEYRETDRAKSIPVEKSVAGKVIKSGKSYLVPNILQEPDYANKEIVKEQGFNSLIAIPITISGFLKAESVIRGAIQIYYREINRQFDPLEVANAELMARRVGYVLAKKRILDLQKLNLQKEKIVEKIFVKLSQREGIKMKDVFRMMIPELVSILQIQSCSLFSITPDRSHVHVELEYPAGQASHEISCMFSIRDHPYLDVLLNAAEKRGDYEYEKIEAAYVLIKDPLKSSLSNDELRTYAAKQNVNSVLLVPLKAAEEINHFLVFYAKDRRQEFTEQEIELLTFFGKEIMKALRMEKLDDVLHDFKNPGIAIAGFARRALKLLEKEDIAAVKDKIAEYLDIVVKETVRMQELATYQNIEGRERVIDLTEVLKNRFLINQEAIKEQRRMGIVMNANELQPGLLIYCSPFGLERVLDNLLDNATKAVPPQGGKLSIRSYRDGNMACIEIHNTGKIPEDNIEQIRKGDVKGRGLNIIYRFIQSNHGKLDVSTDNDSTTFRVMLPLHQEVQTNNN